MPNRNYRVVVAKDLPGLQIAAGYGWTILRNTVREFHTLDTNDDQRLGDIGAVTVDGPGVVAIAHQGHWE